MKGAAAGPVSGAVERATAAGRPRVVPDPPRPVPPLPADPELVRLAQVPLPAEIAQRRGPAAARAGRLSASLRDPTARWALRGFGGRWFNRRALAGLLGESYMDISTSL